MILLVAIAALAAAGALADDGQQLTSPCPQFLRVDPAQFGAGVWGGTLHLRLPKGTIGVFIEMKLDQHINIITNNFSVATTKDNQRFLVEDFKFEPPDGSLVVAFKVKYNAANVAPEFKYIYLNGRKECPGSKKTGNKDEATTMVSGNETIAPEVERTTIPFITINDYDL